MSFSPAAPLDGIRAILFDYGNTLIPYGKREDGIVIDAFHAFLKQHGAPADPAVFRRAVQSVTGTLIERATQTGVEVQPEEKVEGVLAALGLGREDGIVTGAQAAISDGFVAAIEAPAGLIPCLERLNTRYRLALLSNYFIGPPIHASLDKIGVTALLDPRVVSADIGWCKPHRKAFEPALEGLGLAPAEILMVGDNLTADIAGAAALGMRTAHTREHLAGALPYGRPEGDGTRPDVTVESLEQLAELLLGG